MDNKPIVVSLANGLVDIRVEPGRPVRIQAFDTHEEKEWWDLPDVEALALYDALRGWYDER
jgi:hypothetical protein